MTLVKEFLATNAGLVMSKAGSKLYPQSPLGCLLQNLSYGGWGGLRLLNPKCLTFLCSLVWLRYTPTNLDGHQRALLSITCFVILKFSPGTGTNKWSELPFVHVIGELNSCPSLWRQCSMAQVSLAKVAAPPDIQGLKPPSQPCLSRLNHWVYTPSLSLVYPSPSYNATCFV